MSFVIDRKIQKSPWNLANATEEVNTLVLFFIVFLTEEFSLPKEHRNLLLHHEAGGCLLHLKEILRWCSRVHGRRRIQPRHVVLIVIDLDYLCLCSFLTLYRIQYTRCQRSWDRISLSLFFFVAFLIFNS